MKLQIQQQELAHVDSREIDREAQRQVWDRIAEAVREDSRQNAAEYLKSTEVPYGGE